MKTALVVSPNPELSRMLTLALELEGLGVATALDMAEATRHQRERSADVVMLDMIDGSTEQWAEAKKFSAQKKNMKVLILPMGIAKISDKKIEKGFDLVVRRPFELNALVKELCALVSTPKTSSSFRREVRRRS